MSMAVATTTLVPTSCAACGITFGLPAPYEIARRQDGREFYCPNGHHLAWSESELDRTRVALARGTQELDQAKAGARDALAERDAALAALLAHQQRVANGVCPCCNRSFRDLLRHMRDQHPGYAEAQREAAEALACKRGRKKKQANDAP